MKSTSLRIETASSPYNNHYLAPLGRNYTRLEINYSLPRTKHDIGALTDCWRGVSTLDTSVYLIFYLRYEKFIGVDGSFGEWSANIHRSRWKAGNTKRHIPAKTSLTQWRFFKKCRIEDIFCFVSIFTQIFFKVIGNLWAYYKCHLGRIHHVGTWAFVQQRVFSRRAHSQT